MSFLDRQIENNIQTGRFRYIGKGSSRKVYDMNNGYVLKIAKNKAGIEQNKVEYAISNDTNFAIFAEVVDMFSEYKYIIMEKARLIEDISYVWDYLDVQDKYEFFTLPFVKIIKRRYDLIVNDLSRASSWGIINHQLRIIDYGFTREIKRKYY